jgi:hypothetical protein
VQVLRDGGDLPGRVWASSVLRREAERVEHADRRPDPVGTHEKVDVRHGAERHVLVDPFREVGPLEHHHRDARVVEPSKDLTKVGEEEGIPYAARSPPLLEADPDRPRNAGLATGTKERSRQEWEHAVALRERECRFPRIEGRSLDRVPGDRVPAGPKRCEEKPPRLWPPGRRSLGHPSHARACIS